MPAVVVFVPAAMAPRDLLAFLPFVLLFGLPLAIVISQFIRERRDHTYVAPKREPLPASVRNKLIIAIAASVICATAVMFVQPVRFDVLMNYVGLFIAVAVGAFTFIGSMFFTPSGQERSPGSALRQLFSAIASITLFVFITPIGHRLFPTLPDVLRLIVGGVALVLVLIAAYKGWLTIGSSASSGSNRTFSDSDSSSSSSSFSGGGGSGGGGGASGSW